MLNQLGDAGVRMRPVHMWELRSFWTDGSTGAIFSSAILIDRARKGVICHDVLMTCHMLITRSHWGYSKEEHPLATRRSKVNGTQITRAQCSIVPLTVCTQVDVTALLFGSSLTRVFSPHSPDVRRLRSLPARVSALPGEGQWAHASHEGGRKHW